MAPLALTCAILSSPGFPAPEVQSSRRSDVMNERAATILVQSHFSATSGAQRIHPEGALSSARSAARYFAKPTRKLDKPPRTRNADHTHTTHVNKKRSGYFAQATISLTLKLETRNFLNKTSSSHIPLSTPRAPRSKTRNLLDFSYDRDFRETPFSFLTRKGGSSAGA